MKQIKKILIILILSILWSPSFTQTAEDWNNVLKIVDQKNSEMKQDQKRKEEEQKKQYEEYLESKINENINKMVKLPGKKTLLILQTEVTQSFYESVMGENPSYNKGDNNPVERVSWYDAIYFCNKLSEKFGITPVYAVNGKTDVSKWNYTPHRMEEIKGKVVQNKSANGFRLPTEKEWEYAAKGGQNYEYSGSDNLDEVGWYEDNSGYKTHPVAQKKANGYGLYDMSGNVEEWCWDAYGSYIRYYRGGSCHSSGYGCEVSSRYGDDAYYQFRDIGFRIVCNAD